MKNYITKKDYHICPICKHKNLLPKFINGLGNAWLGCKHLKNIGKYRKYNRTVKEFFDRWEWEYDLGGEK